MANQTVTTSVNYDDPSISGLNNGEDIAINGGTLTINGDVRWNQQAAVFGNLTLSSLAVTGLLVDGRDIWEISFDASAGTVPTQTDLGTNGVIGGTSGATGELTRVWATGSLTPEAAGAAMPATGYIKLRTKTGTFQDNEVITLPGGATITVNSTTGGQRSWIHVVGSNIRAITAYGLSDVQFQGDWYYIGETNGTDDQTFQYPVADLCPAIQIETAVGSGQYEWWLNAPTSRWGAASQTVSTDERGKFFGQSSATGVITIARRVSNSCGYKPVTGLKVRIPNILLSNSTSTNWAVNSIDSVLTSRYETNLSNFGSITIEKTCGNWYWNFNAPARVELKNSAILRLFNLNIPELPCTIDSVAIAPDSTLNAMPTFSITGSKAGLTFSNSRMCSFLAGTSSYLVFTRCSNVNLQNLQIESFGGPFNNTKGSAQTLGLNTCDNFIINNCVLIGGKAQFTSSQDIEITNTVYADVINGTTEAAGGVYAFTFVSCSDVLIEGLSPFVNLANVHPRAGILYASSKCENLTAQNIGTYASPYDVGTVNPMDYLVVFFDVSNFVIQRIYTSNATALEPFRTFTTASDINNGLIQNVHSEYSRSQKWYFAKELIFRGCKFNLDLVGTQNRVGQHWMDVFGSSTTGNILIIANQPTTLTASQCVATLSSDSGFTGTGAVYMPTLNDEVLWTMPYFALGYTALSSVTFTGTNTGNFTYTFQYDLGTGWNGSWLTLDATNLAAIGAIDPLDGIKLKVKATTSVANSTNQLRFINIEGTSNTTTQGYQYPYPDDALGIISNLIAGSRIQIYNQTTSTEIFNDVVSGTEYSLSYLSGGLISDNDLLTVRVAYLGYLPQTLVAIATPTGFSAAGNAVVDAIYVANGIDGSTVTEFTADYPNIQVDISDPDQTTTVQRVYAWLRYVETTEDGIAQWFDAVDPTDEVNYEINTAILDLKLDNTQATPVVIGGGRLYRSDGATIIATASSSIQMDPNRVYQAVESIPTATEIADTVLRRSTANVEASLVGDPLSLRSMYGMVAQGTHNTQLKGDKLVITKSDEVTELGTRTVTTSPLAQPITGLNSD